MNLCYPEEGAKCMNFNDYICIGDKEFISPNQYRHQDPSVVLYLDFSNTKGIDMSYNSSNNLIMN